VRGHDRSRGFGTLTALLPFILRKAASTPPRLGAVVATRSMSRVCASTRRAALLLRGDVVVAVLQEIDNKTRARPTAVGADAKRLGHDKRRSAHQIDHRRSRGRSPQSKLVAGFMRGWLQQYRGRRGLAAFFTDERRSTLRYDWRRVTGREAIANNIARYPPFRPGRQEIEGIQFRVINIAANGPV